MSRYIQIDDEGYFSSSQIRLTDEDFCKSLLENLFCENRIFKTLSQGEPIIVEAFDLPLIAHSFEPGNNSIWQLNFPYGYSCEFDLSSLCVDEWDRFRGRTLKKDLPFIFSRTAQMKFFDALETFDDESIIHNKKKYLVPTIIEIEKKNIKDRPDINKNEFWSESYQSWDKGASAPGWELGEVAKPLKEILPQIKLPRSRICILGCGTGHDAAYLASQGHIVTAVDISPEAIRRAKLQNPENHNLKFVCADAFKFAQENSATFDVVFEHTFYCAIDPSRRAEIVKAWRTLLAPGGYLLGIFYLLDRTMGPPFGTSEWELREYLSHEFQFLYWTRWKTSIERRLGAEHIIYAKK